MCVCRVGAVARKQENNLFLILNYVLRSKPLACLQNDCERSNLRLYDFTADRGVYVPSLRQLYRYTFMSAPYLNIVCRTCFFLRHHK